MTRRDLKRRRLASCCTGLREPEGWDIVRRRPAAVRVSVARRGRMPPSAQQRRLRAAWSGPILVAVTLLPSAAAWPLFFNGSGTAQLSSAFGADVLLSPSTGADAQHHAPGGCTPHV